MIQSQNVKNLSILIAFGVIMYFINKFYKGVGLISVESFNGTSFYVRNLSDKQEASDLLGVLKAKIDTLIASDSSELTKKIKRNFNSSNLKEGKSESKLVTYTLNKAEIVLCLRDKQTHKLHTPNLLMYVVIHELAHISSNSIGHTPEFYVNFKKLLDVSEDLGIYEKQNFKAFPRKYCGINITTSLG